MPADRKGERWFGPLQSRHRGRWGTQGKRRLSLSSRGVGVAIFDQRGPAGGPTGRSSAICRAYYTNEFLAEMAKRSIEMLSNFEGGSWGHSRLQENGIPVAPSGS